MVLQYLEAQQLSLKVFKCSKGEQILEIIRFTNDLLIKFVVVKQKTYLMFMGGLIFNNFEPIDIKKSYHNIVLQRFKTICPLNSRIFCSFQTSNSCNFTTRSKIVVSQSITRLNLQQLINLELNYVKESCFYFKKTLLSLGFFNNKCIQALNLIKIQQEFKKKILSIIEGKNVEDYKMEQEQQEQYIGAQPQQISSHLENVSKIEQLYTNSLSSQINREYGSVSKVNCKITFLNGSATSKQLACKSFKISSLKTEEQLKKKQEFKAKLKNEKKIIKKIGNKSKYILNYYQVSNEDSKLYMESKKDTLKDFIKSSQAQMQYLCLISDKIVKGVGEFQKAKVIHRDIKPSNIVMDYDQQTIKFIDFGQSTILNEKLDSNSKLGATLPYSPPQCLTPFKSQNANGCDNINIDIWSVAINIYELIFKKKLVLYSKCFSSDIINNWKNQFLMSISMKKQSGLGLIQDVFNLICIKAVRLNQNERIKLSLVDRLMEEVKKYISQIIYNKDPEERRMDIQIQN